MIEARSCKPFWQRLHSHQNFRNQVRDTLNNSKFPVMLLRRCHEHFQPERAAKKCGDPRSGVASHRTHRNLSASYAIARTLRPEQWVRSHDINEWGQLRFHHFYCVYLYRSHIDDNAARTKIGPKIFDRGREVSHRDGEDHNVAATDSGQIAGPNRAIETISAQDQRIAGYKRDVGYRCAAISWPKAPKPSRPTEVTPYFEGIAVPR